MNLCEAPLRLLVHQYLNRLDPYDWAGNLLSLQAFLMTQVRCDFTLYASHAPMHSSPAFDISQDSQLLP